ncbi:hypothetical protein [Nocardioides nitrophenolicus]|uniref:hypothetical protein n=1 Tax=Nocardioides nitrophenolicus TaxID=60489 RepID=UPI000ACCF853|nr:hypothetical protein [Nocardioides nitrophenolicus]MBM7518285.1 hypothetical protein [Nocardioides nitrophenolicus]
MTDVTRVVLVKPDDVLVFGNIGPANTEVMSELGERIKAVTGASLVVFFADDIDLAAVPR